jgi:hypothetical protein
MTQNPAPPVPAAVYLIADNLDAVLAAGEDLLKLQLDCGVASSEVPSGVRTFTEQARTFEMIVAARTLQARARAQELRISDHRYRALSDLFIAGTAALQDAVADLGNSTSSDFHSGSDPISYLRARTVIPADAAGLSHFGLVTLTEAFRVAERIELGPLMDLCATFLDRLEDHYELYPVDASSPAHQAA